MSVKKIQNSNQKQMISGMIFAAFICGITAALVYYLDLFTIQ